MNISTKDPLAQVAEHFVHWRAIRKKQSRIPDELWNLITPLQTQYSLDQIQGSLKINPAQLKKKLQGLNSVTSNNFIQCATPKAWPLLPAQGVTLSFVCKTGKNVIVSSLQASELALAINTLLGE